MDRMLIMMYTYSLLVTFISASPIPASNAMRINATCDDNIKVYADGQDLFSNDNSVGEVTNYQMSSCPQVIAIKCKDNSIMGGIIASIGNEQFSYVTDSSWKCTKEAQTGTAWTEADFDDSAWGDAQTITNYIWRGQHLEGITGTDAQWIWTTTDIGVDTKVYCRKEITECQETAATGTGYDCDDHNPCNPLVEAEKYYYAHYDPNKYVQCSTAGQCFVQPCPGGLVWNDEAMTCAFS